MLTSILEICFHSQENLLVEEDDSEIRSVIPRVKCLCKINHHPGKAHAQSIVHIQWTEGQSRDTTSEADMRVQEVIHDDEVRGTPPDETSSYYCPWTWTLLGYCSCRNFLTPLSTFQGWLITSDSISPWPREKAPQKTIRSVQISLKNFSWEFFF